MEANLSMHLFFIDESGSAPPPEKKNTKYFVLGGVSIPEDHWHSISDELKIKYGIDHEIKWRFFSPHNKDDENKIRFLDIEKKEAFRKELFSSITKYKAVKIISVVNNIEESYKLDYINNAEDIHSASYIGLTRKFQNYLQDLTRTVGQKINGIIVCDHRGSRDDKNLRNLHHKLLDSGKSKNLIEGLFIASSDLSVGIQYDDIIAGSIFRKFEKGDDKYFNLIKNSIRTNITGDKTEGYGIAIFPNE